MRLYYFTNSRTRSELLSSKEQLISNINFILSDAGIYKDSTLYGWIYNAKSGSDRWLDGTALMLNIDRHYETENAFTIEIPENIMDMLFSKDIELYKLGLVLLKTNYLN